MVYLEFGEDYVRLKDEAGKRLWQSSETKLPWLPPALAMRRGIITLSCSVCKRLRSADQCVPFPDGTIVYGSKVDTFRDELLLKVFHPDLPEKEEGRKLPYYDPTFVETDAGLTFESWNANH